MLDPASTQVSLHGEFCVWPPRWVLDTAVIGHAAANTVVFLA